MSRNSIRVETVAGIATLWMDRPPANALDLDTTREFAEALAGVSERKDIGAVIVTGSGSCFSAGLDLKAIPTYDRDQQQAMVLEVNRLFGRLYEFPLPTIAAVNGHAIAGGVILTLACDYRIGADGQFKLGLAELRVGVPFPVSAMSIVQSELSHRAARVMVLTARNFNPRDALSFGVLDELQPADSLIKRAEEVAREMSELPRATYARIKRQLRARALSRINDAIDNRNEPMLESWLGAETLEASAEALKKQ